MNNSQYSPTAKSGYSSKDLNVDFKGAKFDITVNSESDNDFLVTDDSIFDGMTLDVLNSTLGDKVSFQIVDKDNILGYGANVVLKQFATDIYITPTLTRQVDHDSSYPAKIYAGLYLRIKYTSTSTVTTPTVIVRYKLHKILW